VGGGWVRLGARRGAAVLALGAAAASLAACGGGGGSGDGGRLTAAGSTFAAPAYQRWGQQTGLVSYTGTGSGAGIQALIAGTVAFAGSDAPLNADERSQLRSARRGGRPLYFPTLLGAVTIPVNLPDLGGRLRLSGDALGRIFAGTLTRWDDPAIARTNPGLALPDAPIVVCARSESSGTSFTLSTYLSKVSPTFRARVGTSKTPPWSAPNLVRVQGNPAVATCVTTNDDAIGYVDLGDAQRAGLQDRLAAIQARDGTFVVPSTASASAAADLPPSQVPADLAVDLTDSPARGAYPITTTTWIVATAGRDGAARAREPGYLRRFLRFAYGRTAQGELPRLGYAPLSAALRRRAVAQIGALR
jgi:phosphate transport system substrate-binding protein